MPGLSVSGDYAQLLDDAPETTSRVVVDAAPNETKPAKRITGTPKLTRVELISVSHQLSIMLDAGVQLAEALDCVGAQMARPQAQAVLEDVSGRVASGSDLSAALGHHPASFPQLFIALIKASEKAGMLPLMLRRATAYLKNEREIVQKVRGALTYPSIMFSFAVLTTVFLLAFVLPRFTKIYAGKEAALPMPTKVLMGMSDFVVGHWLLLLIGTAVAAGVGWWWLGTEGGKRFWHVTQLRLPLLGPMFRDLHLSRGLRVVGTTAAAGVPLLECVGMARELTDNSRFQQLWDNTHDQIEQGTPFSSPLTSHPLVPAGVAEMVKAGEVGGKLGMVLEHIAESSEDQLKDRIAQLTRYIEPAMIVGMGALIGGVTMAMLLPVFQISRVMAQ
ncbi:MAG: type II secretion system F family protein [Planctomycetota bacterium]